MTKHIFSLFLILLITVNLISCSIDNKETPLADLVDNSTQTNDGGTYFPNSNGSTDVCEEDNNDNCIDSSENTAYVTLTTQSLEFGLNEQYAQECQSITIPGGLTYSAEIDKEFTSKVNGIYQFALQTSSGSITQDRVEGTGEVTICYLRDMIGTHRGQIKVVLDAESEGPAYAYVISTKGETMTKVFTIDSPSPMQIIDKDNNEGVDNNEGDYLITASGSVNMNLVSIFKDGADSDIIINAGGVKYKTKFNEDGHFSKSAVGLSQTQGVYNVTFSLETNKGSDITKTIPVVVAGAPHMELEVRDVAGNKIDVLQPTDAPNLVLGIKVVDLPSSGSDQTLMPVTLYDIMLNGTELASDTDIWYDNNKSWCPTADDPDVDYEGFDAGITYCIPLKQIKELQSGINVISAKAKNSLGSTFADIKLILDNNKPIITISSPLQNELFNPGITHIKIEGSVKNFAPLEISKDTNTLSQVPSAQDGDIGSYCQPKDKNDSSCPPSSVKLWFNISTDEDNLPIYIYPDSSYYDEDTISQNNEEILDDDNTVGNCQTSENTETIFDGDSENTTIDADGNIVTTVTDPDDGTVTTYTTDTDGNVTITISNGDAPSPGVTIEDKDNVENKITIADDGDITSEVDDHNTDIYVSTTTDSTNGKITQTVRQQLCNIPYGKFSLNLDVPSDDYYAPINLFSNILQFQAESISGHITIKLVTFQVGLVNPDVPGNKNNSEPKRITSGPLGIVKQECPVGQPSCVDRAPIMLNLSEGVINHNSDSEEARKVIKVVEQLLNDNFKFEDFANGWSNWPKRGGKIELENDFQKQYMEKNNGERYDDFNNLSKTWKEKFITQGLHSNIMAMKYWALTRYVDLLQDEDNKNCLDRPDLCFFEREGDPETEFNVAQDKCGEAITTAFVPIGDIRHVAKYWPVNVNDIRYLPEWNDVAGDDIKFNDFVSGRWLVHSINLKPNGVIDADICLVPDDKDYPSLTDRYATYGCDADVSDAKTPAFWGHFIGYNLVNGGLLGSLNPAPINDDTLPMIWSVGKLRLKLTDVFRLTHEQIGDTWSNKLIIDKDKIDIIEYNELEDLHNPDAMAEKSIQIEPFGNCSSYYMSQFPGYELPFGCSNDPNSNYPFILEMNSSQSRSIYNGLMFNGQSTYMLGVVWQGVLWTFKKIVGCLDEEMVNPILSDAYKFPSWVWAENALSTDFEWEDFTFNINLKNSDLKVYDGGITARIPLTLGVKGIPRLNDSDSRLTLTPIPMGRNYTKAFIDGHLIRSFSNAGLTDYPLRSRNPQQEAFVGLSLNVEEVVNAAAYLLFKKGPFALLDLLDIDEIVPFDNWRIPVDKVILGRFDMCDIAGLVSTDLPNQLLFSDLQSLFQSPTTHLEVILDKDYPITLALKEIEGVEDAVDIQLGITNVQIAVKELFPYIDPNTGEAIANVYENPKDQSEVFRLRVDGVISLKAIYHKASRKLNLFVEGYDKQNIHLSVPAGHSGATYNDILVVRDLISTVVIPMFETIKKEFDPSDSDDVEPTIQVTFKGDDNGNISVKGIDDIDIQVNVDAAENAKCGDNVPHYVEEWQAMDHSDEGEGTGTGTGTGTGGNTGTRPNIAASERVPLDTDQFSDPCKTLIASYNDDNPITDALCDIGIDDVSVSPNIIFDTDNGYIHVSAEMYFKLKDWLEAN